MDYIQVNSNISCKKADIQMVLDANKPASKILITETKNKNKNSVIDICAPNTKKEGVSATGGRKKRGAILRLINGDIIITNLSYKTIMKRLNSETSDVEDENS